MVLGWYLDLAKNDTDAVAELLSLSDDVVVIGTDPDEVWVGGANIRAIVKRQMQQVGKVNLDPGEIMAFEEGSVGWAIDSGTMGSSDGSKSSFRGAFVLHREEGNWKIVMAHFSNATSTVRPSGATSRLHWRTSPT